MKTEASTTAGIQERRENRIKISFSMWKPAKCELIQKQNLAKTIFFTILIEHFVNFNLENEKFFLRQTRVGFGFWSPCTIFQCANI